MNASQSNGREAGRADVDAIAAEAFAVLGAGRQIAPFSGRFSPFRPRRRLSRRRGGAGMKREARGERPIGRKIGFTNRTIWAEYGVYAPMWGHVYDRTVHDLVTAGPAFSLERLRRTAHRAGDRVWTGDSAGRRAWTERALHRLRRVDRPRLRDRAVDLPRLEVRRRRHRRRLWPARRPADRAASSGGVACRQIGRASSPHFEIDLFRNGALADHGRAANVLDGPVFALQPSRRPARMPTPSIRRSPSAKSSPRER